MVQAMEKGSGHIYMYKGREGIGHMYYSGGAGIRKEKEGTSIFTAKVEYENQMAMDDEDEDAWMVLH